MFKTRFAPSPTGLLHLGHAYSALAAHEQAQEAGGEMLLRIEDIDQTRCRPEFTDAIFEDMRWLGLRWPEPVRHQSMHMTEYGKPLEVLIKSGIAYRCFRTRKEVLNEIALAPHLGANGPEGPVFAGEPLPTAEEDALVAEGKPFAWRLSMAAAKSRLGCAWDDLSFTEEGAGPGGETGLLKATPEIFGDIIIARKDVGTSYHMAAVHDDAHQGVTHVVRGQDLFHAAHLHRLLQALLDLPTPIYRHHRLITDKAGKKFSKRDNSVTLRAIREAGTSAADLRRQLTRWPADSRAI